MYLFSVSVITTLFSKNLSYSCKRVSTCLSAGPLFLLFPRFSLTFWCWIAPPNINFVFLYMPSKTQLQAQVKLFLICLTHQGSSHPRLGSIKFWEREKCLLFGDQWFYLCHDFFHWILPKDQGLTSAQNIGPDSFLSFIPSFTSWSLRDHMLTCALPSCAPWFLFLLILLPLKYAFHSWLNNKHALFPENFRLLFSLLLGPKGVWNRGSLFSMSSLFFFPLSKEAKVGINQVIIKWCRMTGCGQGK